MISGSPRSSCRAPPYASGRYSSAAFALMSVFYWWRDWAQARGDGPVVGLVSLKLAGLDLGARRASRGRPRVLEKTALLAAFPRGDAGLLVAERLLLVAPIAGASASSA